MPLPPYPPGASAARPSLAHLPLGLLKLIPMLQKGPRAADDTSIVRSEESGSELEASMRIVHAGM